MQTFHPPLCPHRCQEVTVLCKKPINYCGRRSAGTPCTHSADSTLNHLLNDGPSGGGQRLTEGQQTSASSKVASKGSWRPGAVKGSYGLWLWKETFLILDKQFCQLLVLWLQTDSGAPTWLLPVPNAGSFPIYRILGFQRGQYFPRFSHLKLGTGFPCSCPAGFVSYLMLFFPLILTQSSPHAIFPPKYILKGNIISCINEVELVKGTGSGGQLSGFKSCLWYLLAM